MMENEEFQKLLAKYPLDALIALQVRFNGEREILFDFTIEGIQFPMGDEIAKVIVLGSEDLDMEYESILNGADADETIYRE